MHLAVDTLDDLLVLIATAVNTDDRTQGATLATAVHEATGDSVELA